MWDCIDGAICITLDTATKRHGQVQRELERVGLWPKTVMLVNKRDPQGGLRGCFESHRKAWQLAHDRHMQNVLILEDDVFFSNDWHKYMPAVQNFVLNATDWDCLFLGWTPFRARKTNWKHITKIVCGTAMHAYIVSAQALQKSLPSYDDVKMPLDLYLMCPQCPGKQRFTPFNTCMQQPNPMMHMYALKPMIAFQRYDSTSATGNDAAGNRRKARVCFMRIFGQGAVTSDTPTLALTFGLVFVILFVILLAVIVVVVSQRS